MKRIAIPLLSLLILLLSACSAAPKQYSQLEPRQVELDPKQPILLELDHGEATILPSEDGAIKIEGELLYPEQLEYQVNTSGGQISIKIFAHQNSLSTPVLRLKVYVPQEQKLKIETDTASISARGINGELEVASTSGDITAAGFTGRLMLRSNRGDILVQESSGVIGIVGNYGTLTLVDVSGESSASNIIGNITFSGTIDAGDTVRLEEDHGSILTNLGPDSDVTVKVHSTSGDVVCLVPSLETTTRSCDGQLLTGAGSLAVRTVSGAVKLQYLP
jgi:hypothetical protein